MAASRSKHSGSSRRRKNSSNKADRQGRAQGRSRSHGNNEDVSLETEVTSKQVVSQSSGHGKRPPISGPKKIDFAAIHTAMRKRATKQVKADVDPHADREAKKYDNPIPSREFILAVITDAGKPMTRERVAEALKLDNEDQLEGLRRRLRAMERDGQLIYNRRGGYLPVDMAELVRGRVVGHRDGFGFVVPEEGGDDLFMNNSEMRSLMHGDRVVVRVANVDRRGRREGALVEVLERAHDVLVGHFVNDQGVGMVSPDNKRIAQDIIVPKEDQSGATDGQVVLVQIVEQPTRHRGPVGKIIEILGDRMAPGMEIDIAIRAHELPREWSPAVLEEIKSYGEEVPEEAKEGRVDLRDVPLVTIDGADARDFDDAVFCKRTKKGWKLLVAIADVSHYVAPGSALDESAQERGTSVYFPGQVIPMLPEVLSNGLCSINPLVDRLCMVAEIFVDEQGEVYRSKFMEAVMRSHARLIYDDVWDMLNGKKKALVKKHQALMPHLKELHNLYKVLRAARDRRGSIDFETTETQIIFGADRKIEDIVPVERNEAHKLIEECMLLANQVAAKYLLKNKMPALYRIHDGPAAEKLDDLRSFLGELGLQLDGGAEPGPVDFNKLLTEARNRPDAHLIQTVLMRTLKQAVYSPDNVGHFGLSMQEYTHFTSPIRRYPDLLVHRAIRHLVRGGTPKTFEYTHDQMAQFGQHSSMTERRADEATRDATDWLKCEYLLDKVGETYSGLIRSVTSFGLFVELDNIFVDGLVHITALKNDYYKFDPVGHRLQGERTGHTYQLGDRIQVTVVRVDLDQKKIDFDLPENLVAAEDADKNEDAKPARKSSKRGRRRRSGGGGKSKKD